MSQPRSNLLLEIERFVNRQPPKEVLEQIVLIVYDTYRDRSDIDQVIYQGRDGVRIITDKLSDNIVQRMVDYVRKTSSTANFN
jgi:hypothetical protein